MSENNMTKKARGSALIPFLVFIVVYLGAGIILEVMGMDMAFYQFPSPVAALIGIIVAFIIFKGSSPYSKHINYLLFHILLM